MTSTWAARAPLIIGSAVVPVQIIMTILLLRSTHGRRTAICWIAGMTAVRLLQGLLFGLVLASAPASTGNGNTSPFTAGLLLVVGVLLLVLAARQFFHAPDPDDAPPKWLTMTETMTPARAFLIGGGLLVIGAKFWVFTLSAIAVIGDADLTPTQSIALFLLFMLLAESIHLVIVGAATIAPKPSTRILEHASAWLQDHNRVIVIVLGVLFGIWFVLKGLAGIGLI